MNLNRYRLFLNKLFLRLKRLSSLPIDYLASSFYNQRSSDKKRLIFIGTVMHARIARLAKWLKRHHKLQDYEFILICDRYQSSSHLSGDLFDKVCYFSNKYSLILLLKQNASKGAIYHLFGPPYDAIEVVLDKLLPNKVFFDYQDLLISNFGLNPPFKYMKEGLKVEEKVINSVNGIICHSLELQSAKNHFGKIETPVLYFPNYTDNDAFITPKLEKENNEIHIVYAGSVYSAFRNTDYFGSSQFHWLIKLLNEQKIHLHIYPTPVSNKEDHVDYIKMDREMDYFHFHESVSQEKLGIELSKYDFGILPFFNSKTKRIIDKRKYSTTLKLFNFIEAGLPVIISEDVLFQGFLARRFGSAIKVSESDLGNLRELLKRFDLDTMHKNIEHKREALSLKANIDRLVDFYFN